MQNIKNQITYHLNKFIFLLSVKFEYIFLKLYYLRKNHNLNHIIIQNRRILNNINKFLEEKYYLNNDYGIQKRIYDKIDLPISNNVTYSDLLVYLYSKIFKDGMNYLEIGCSVLKNFIQVKSNVANSNLVCFDINPINPTLEELFFEEKNNNSTSYFQGDVLNRSDIDSFKSENDLKFNIIFSDALHNEEGVYSEYINIYKNMLDEKFIIYFDDLEFDGVMNAAHKIKEDLSSYMENINFFQFKVGGWIGEHEKTHLNGIISNVNILEMFLEDNIDIYKLRNL